MDLGTYERMLDQDLTARQLHHQRADLPRRARKERHGGYLGRDVQMIPHVTGEVKYLLREAGGQAEGRRGVRRGRRHGRRLSRTPSTSRRCANWPSRRATGAVLLRRADVRHRAAGPGRAEVQGRPARHQAADGGGHSAAHRRLPRRARGGEKVRQKIAMFSNVPMRRVFSHARPRVDLHRSPKRCARTGWTARCCRCWTCTTACNADARGHAHRDEWRDFVQSADRQAQAPGAHRHHRQVRLPARRLRVDRQGAGALRGAPVVPTWTCNGSTRPSSTDAERPPRRLQRRGRR